MQVIVELEPAVFGLDAGRFQVQRLKVGSAAGGVHNQIGIEGCGLRVGYGMHDEPVRRLLDALDARLRAHVDADVAGSFGEPGDDIGVERLQQALGALEHRNLRPGARGDVRELGGDVATADEDDAFGKLFQF